MTDEPSDDEPVEDEPVEDEPDAADRIVLRASAMRWVWTLIGSMVFATLGAGMALGEGTGVVARGIGWLLIGLFGFCGLVSLRQILNPGSLVVSRDGIDMIHRGRLATFSMNDCGRFTTWLNPSRGTTSVVFDYALDGDTELNRTNRRLMGGSRSFSDSYGLPAEVLAKLLNDARDGAAASNGDGPMS